MATILLYACPSREAVSRLLLYGGGVCLSLPVFRSREARGISTPDVEPALFRVMGGPIFASIGVVVSLLLATRTGVSDAIKMGAVIGLAAVHWWLVRANLNQGTASRTSTLRIVSPLERGA